MLFFKIPIKLKVFIQTLHKIQDRHKIIFFYLIIKTPKKSPGQIGPPRYYSLEFTFRDD